MGEQPGAGRGHPFKIKGHSRYRRVAKPYARQSDHKKGVLQSVKDFFSPSWLLDFWKGKTVVQEEDVDDFDDDGEGEPTVAYQESAGPSRELETTGTTNNLGEICGLDRRNEVLGNGGPGFMASSKRRSQPSQNSGLSALLAIKSRQPLTRKAIQTKTSALPSSMGDSSRSDDIPSARAIDIDLTESTVERDSMTQKTTKTSSSSASRHTEPGPSPIFSSSQTKTTPSLFGTSLLPGSSSTPIASEPLATPGPSFVSSERTPMSSSSRPQPTSVFRSKPEFSVSAFGSVFPPRSSSQTQRYTSPYYSGKTIFGGASLQVSKTSKRARIQSPGSVEAAKPVKRQIRPTPTAGASGGGVASQTAKRILETLEKMSSPLEDAKKIPPSPPYSASSSPLSFSQSKRRKAPPQPYNRPVGSPRKLEAKFGAPPVQSLSVPQRAAVSRIHPKAVATTSQITSTPLATISTEKKSSTIPSKPIQSFVPTPLPVSLSPMESAKGSGGGGKIRTAKTSSTHYKAQTIDDDEEEVVNPLPVITSAVSLTIPSGSSMPSFSFSSTLSTTSTKTTTNKAELPLSTVKSKSPHVSSNNFKFSVPEPKSFSSKNISSKSPSHKKIEFSFSSPAPVNNSETTNSNNVICSDSIDKCTQNASNDLFKELQPPSDSCMSFNKQSDLKYMASETPKPSSSVKDNEMKNTVSQSSKGTLLKEFAPASDSWECPTCMISNKSQDDKCVACQEQKPGGDTSKPTNDNLILKQFAPKQGSWTCDTCMIVNNSDNLKCVACESPKPGSSSTPNTVAFSGGSKVSAENKVQSCPFKFGSTDNKESSNTKVTFGVSTSSSSNTSSFKLSSTSATSTPFVFGAAQTSSSSDKPFTFGSGSATSKPEDIVTKSTAASSNSDLKSVANDGSAQSKPAFQFGSQSNSSVAPVTYTFGSKASSADKQPTGEIGSTTEKDSNKPALFTFGGNTSSSNNSAGKAAKESPKKTAKVGSIAQAAAAGLLKIPSSSVDVVDLTSDNSASEPIKSQSEGTAPPPNVNLFGGNSASNTKQMFSLPPAPKSEVPSASVLPSLPLTFGVPEVTAKPQEVQPKALPAFSFTPSTTATATIPKFGETSVPAVVTSAPVQGFQFGTSLASNDKTTAASTITGSQINFTVPQQGTGFTGFQAASKKTTTTVSSTPFAIQGSTDGILPTQNTGFAFGSPAPAGNGGFSFGGISTKQSASTTDSTPAPFAFGAQTSDTQKPFSFGSSTQPFAFGGSNPSTQVNVPPTVSEESMDADGNNNNNTPPAVPAFGSIIPTTSQPAAGFNFSQAAPTSGFNFGSTQQPSSFKFGDASSNPPVFGGSTAAAFGSNTATSLPQSASSGFNFGSAAPSGMGSQPGGFSLGGGGGGSTSAFSAASSGVATKRVIKRGIRRSKR